MCTSSSVCASSSERKSQISIYIEVWPNARNCRKKRKASPFGGLEQIQEDTCWPSTRRPSGQTIRVPGMLSSLQRALSVDRVGVLPVLMPCFRPHMNLAARTRSQSNRYGSRPTTSLRAAGSISRFRKNPGSPLRPPSSRTYFSCAFRKRFLKPDDQGAANRSHDPYHERCIE